MIVKMKMMMMMIMMMTEYPISSSSSYSFISLTVDKTQLYSRHKVKNEKVTKLRELM